MRVGGVELFRAHHALVTVFWVTYRHGDGYRTARVVQADRVVDKAGVTTFSLASPGSGAFADTVVWRVLTDRVESCQDTTAADEDERGGGGGGAR